MSSAALVDQAGFFFFKDPICSDEAVCTVFDSGVNWSQPVIRHDVTRSALCVWTWTGTQRPHVGVNDFILRSLCSGRKTKEREREWRECMLAVGLGNNWATSVQRSVRSQEWRRCDVNGWSETGLSQNVRMTTATFNHNTCFCLWFRPAPKL